jgi:hypothetical protein
MWSPAIRGPLPDEQDLPLSQRDQSIEALPCAYPSHGPPGQPLTRCVFIPIDPRDISKQLIKLISTVVGPSFLNVGSAFFVSLTA